MGGKLRSKWLTGAVGGCVAVERLGGLRRCAELMLLTAR